MSAADDVARAREWLRDNGLWTNATWVVSLTTLIRSVRQDEREACAAAAASVVDAGSQPPCACIVRSFGAILMPRCACHDVDRRGEAESWCSFRNAAEGAVDAIRHRGAP